MSKHLRQLIREELEHQRLIETKIEAGAEYDRSKEAPKRAFEAVLKLKASEMSPNMLGQMRTGSPDHLRLIEDALDEAGIDDVGLRGLISGPFKMIPPHFLLRI